MNKQTLAKISSILLTILFVGCEILLFLTLGTTNEGIVKVIVGLFVALIFATPIHEFGHIVFAKLSKMQVVYAKVFCLSFKKAGVRYALKLTNPFLADETSVMPTTVGNIQKRFLAYALGGLIFSAVLIVTLTLIGILADSVVALGMLPYAGYIFLLNALPFEYQTGKTDCAVALGILRGEDSEKAMLLAFDIQSRLSKENTYAEIEKQLFDFPVLREDDPIFVMSWDLKYRRALALDDLYDAVDCINRMSQAEEYMQPSERERLAVELTYLNAVNGNLEKANECCKYCEGFLRLENATAKRVLATVACVSGDLESAKLLVESGLRLLENEEIYGEKKLEETLLLRIKIDD